MSDKPKKLTQAEIRESITEKIVTAIKNGTPPWRMPYRTDPNAGFPTNVVSSASYAGVNTLLLQATALDRGYKSKWWATYEQWKKMGGQVMKRPSHIHEGDWGTRIVFYRPIKKEEEEAMERGERKHLFFVLKCFTLFNVEQVEADHLGMYRCNPDELEDRFLSRLNYDHVDEAVEATKAKIVQADEARYNVIDDVIEMPKKSRFHDLKGYYGTLFNSLVKWTAHPKRLNWPGKLKLAGGDVSPLSELIAEIGACYLEDHLRIPHSDDMTNHNAYVNLWLGMLGSNYKRVFDASSQAGKAVDYILQFSRPEVKVDGE